MGETTYELLSLGLRYWFILLIVLTLLRAYLLMRADRKVYRQTLRQLPDAGLIGEVVNLATGEGQPLPREGMIGGSRSCDVRISGLHRREIEFVFRPGFGVKLLPIHHKHRVLIDSEPLMKGVDYALHGTVLDIRGTQLRFRLFAGLDLPARQVPHSAVPQPVQNGFDVQEPLPITSFPEPTPPVPVSDDLEMTWKFAPLPPETFEPESGPPIQQRRRRSTRGTEEDGHE
ncbi:MAG: hypothetical protein GXZ04_02025 [Clostridiales bacterium]|nr:hypothetical protein [Clostridiales bacterium]